MEDPGGNNHLVGIDFNYHNPGSATSLSKAVRAGKLSLVKKLISRGKNPNVPDNRGWTSLHEAALDEKRQFILCYLLDNGAYIEHKTVEGETALFLASSKGNCVGVEILLKAGAKVNSETNSGLTPLHASCLSSSNSLIIEKLLSAGADFNKKEYFESQTPLHIAISEKNIEAINFLVKLTNGQVLNNLYDNDVLLYAIRKGGVMMLKAILKHIPNGHEISKNFSTIEGWTLLMEAAQARDPETVSCLLELGADPLTPDNRGVTALHVGGHSQDPRSFELLLKATQSLENIYVPLPLPPPPHSPSSSSPPPRSPSPPLTPPSLIVLLMDSGNLSGLRLLLDRPDLPSSLLYRPHLHPTTSPLFALSQPAFLFFGCFNLLPQLKIQFLRLLIEKKIPLDVKLDEFQENLRCLTFVEAVLEGHKNHVGLHCSCLEALQIALSQDLTKALSNNTDSSTHLPNPSSINPNHLLSPQPGKICSLLLATHYIPGTRFILGLPSFFKLHPNDVAKAFVKQITDEGYIFFGEEKEYFKFLLSQVSNYEEIGKVLEKGGETETWRGILSSIGRVPTLRRLSRSAVVAPLSPPTRLPSSLQEYLCYVMDSPKPE